MSVIDSHYSKIYTEMIKKIVIVVVFLFSVSLLNAEIIEKTYYFDEPVILETKQCQLVQFGQSFLSGLAGEPTLPWHRVSLLLPPGEEAVSIEISFFNRKKLERELMLLPYQPSRPLSEEKQAAFLKNQAIYQSNEAYPVLSNGKLTTSWLNGMGFAFASFTPVSYYPESGELYYATEVKVSIETKPARKKAEMAVWLNQSTKKTISALAQNPEAVDFYVERGREIGNYDMLIISPESYFDQFDIFVDMLYQRGFKAELASKEMIQTQMEGIDLQEKIRNYIIEAYNTDGIQYVLLGGDVELIPSRGLYCYVESGGGYESSNIPADLYYAALDGNWNDDNDDRWGEPGEDDLLPELAIARLPFGNAAELDNLLNKTMMYQQQPVLGELEKPLFAGENLYNNPDTWGRDYLELLVGETDENGYTTNGIPVSYDIEKLYEYNASWSGNDLINSINQGKQFVHHVGHASQTYVAHLYNSDITDANFAATNGVDHNFTLLHTHGCDCGAFDYNDCILEKMVLIENFAVAVIGNSRYGWFNEGQTEGPAAHLHREMTDAFYHDKIPYLGMAMRESKIETAPWVTAPGQWEEGALRWNFYDLNILGDPLLSVWTSEPFEPEVDYTSELIIGLTETVVEVAKDGEPLAGYRCHLRHNGEILGIAETDADGNALIIFDEPLNQTGEAELVIVGQNILTQILPTTVIPNEGPYVILEVLEVVGEDGNGLADYGETIALNVGLKNIGSEAVVGVEVILSTLDDYVNLIEYETAVYGVIEPGETMMLEAVFLLEIDLLVPDQQDVEFQMIIVSGDQQWETNFELILQAPNLYLSGFLIDDAGGNQNNMLDPGETVSLHIFGENRGGSSVDDVSLSFSSAADEWILIENPNQEIGTLLPDESFEVVFTVHVDEYTPQGTIALMNFYLDCPLDDWYYDYPHSWLMPIGLQIEDFETGDFTAYEWIMGMANNWQIVEDVVYEGSFAAKSAQIADDQLSELKINMFVYQQDEISFYRKVSSESGYDFLKFYVDEMQVAQWSGEIDWELVELDIPEGQHTLKWVYSKDGSVSNGNDCAWIDYITFPATATIMAVNTVSATNSDFQIYPNPGDGTFWFDASESIVFQDVKLYQLDGKLVFKQQEWRSSQVLDVRFLQKGMYVVEMNDGKATFRKKLLIQ